MKNNDKEVYLLHLKIQEEIEGPSENIKGGGEK